MSTFGALRHPRSDCLVGAAALIVASVLAMLNSRDGRHLRHRLPERQPVPMEELPA